MPDNDIKLIAHLMRRAAFGATRDELEVLAAKGYEAVVEDLVNPERFPPVEEDLIERYYFGENYRIRAGKWYYRMINSKRPLEEKMALFWHHVFATAISKILHVLSVNNQIEMLRRVGLSDLRTILIELSKDPAMLFWLDNNENRKGEPNENYGRELLELFSMGVGNYTEDDIKSASRAFSGWTFTQPVPVYPHGHYPALFVYREDDHDDGVKTFLGETGRFNGEDIIDIIVRQPATARFISRHLYNFFVADEPQVPSWNEVPPKDPQAIETLMVAYFESDADMRHILKTLFSSDFFKEARFKKVKSPAELVAGVIKLVGTYRDPDHGVTGLSSASMLMGQDLLNPPTVEGWHTGKEWIDGGTLSERINFAVNEVGDSSKPGIQAIINRIRKAGTLSAEQLVEMCLELAGPVEANSDTRKTLVKYAQESQGEPYEDRVPRMLQLIVSTTEFQFA